MSVLPTHTRQRPKRLADKPPEQLQHGEKLLDCQTIPWVVSVDTEEEGLWKDRYPVRDNTTENLRGLSRFQTLCERFGIAPTYLITAPVLDDRVATRELSSWQEAGTCEVGAHCHPWCNPPLAKPEIPVEESFLKNLPQEEQHAKLEWLTERIADRFGRRPTSFRAGRYGFDATTAQCLGTLGYEVDSSVMPLFDFRGEHGPDFRNSPESPYWLKLTGDRKLLELPITSGFTNPGFRWRRSLWQRVRRSPWKHVKVPGILDRIGVASRVKLCPEGYSPVQLRRLIDSRLKEKAQVLILMLHSSSLMTGMSRYVPDDEHLERLYQSLEAAFGHAVHEHKLVPTTLTAAARMLAPVVPA